MNTSRQDLIDYCLRQLGYPVIEINVDDAQIDDCVDDALLLYQEFHGDASFRNYWKYQVQQADVDNGYIAIPDDILTIIKMFPVDAAWLSSNNMFSFKYQFAMSDFHTLASPMGSISYYEQTMQYMSMINMKLNGQPQISAVRKANRVYLWGDFEDKDVKANDYVIFEVVQLLDPETHGGIWNDMFMRDYTEARIKYQWGQNMSKFEGMTLPGGVTISGSTMKEEAKMEMEQLRERLRMEHELPVDMLIG